MGKNISDEVVFNLIAEDKIDPIDVGFHWRSHGRGAIIYYIENLGIIPIYCEMPAVDYLDVLVFGETKHIENRYYLHKKTVEHLPFEERLRIQKLLVDWLSERGCRHDINVGQ